jgi:NitT/TauT family transport system substrate-binding protein
MQHVNARKSPFSARTRGRRPQRALGIASSVIAVACALAACSSGADPSASGTSTAGSAKQSFGTLRVVLSETDPNAAPYYVAKCEGYFSQVGFSSVSETIAGGGSAAVAALAGGSADIATSSLSAVATAASKGAPVRAIAATYVGSQGAITLAKNKTNGLTASSPLKARIAALKGLTISVSPAGSGAYNALQGLLEYGGVSPSDVTMISTSTGTAMVAALKAGRTDGFFFSSLFNAEAAESGDGVTFIDSAQVPTIGTSYVNAIDMNKSEIGTARATAIVKALQLAHNFIVSNKSAAAGCLDQYFSGVPSSVIKATFNEEYPYISVSPVISDSQAAAALKSADLNIPLDEFLNQQLMQGAS